jgi:hypothetical protein
MWEEREVGMGLAGLAIRGRWVRLGHMVVSLQEVLALTYARPWASFRLPGVTTGVVAVLQRIGKASIVP